MVPINLLAVLLAAIAAFAVGAVWYSGIFGKKWRHFQGLSLEDMKSMKMTPLGASIGTLIVSFLMAYVLAHGIEFGNAYLSTGGVAGGLQGAFWYWLGFAVPITSMAYLYEGKSWKLWAINAGYYLVALLAMGAIIGAL